MNMLKQICFAGTYFGCVNLGDCVVNFVCRICLTFLYALKTVTCLQIISAQFIIILNTHKKYKNYHNYLPAWRKSSGAACPVAKSSCPNFHLDGKMPFCQTFISTFHTDLLEHYRGRCKKLTSAKYVRTVSRNSACVYVVVRQLSLIMFSS